MDKYELINQGLLKNVKTLIETARKEAYKSINLITLQTNFEIGRLIVEEEQRGKERAEYGDHLISNLSKELTKTFGRGFSISNLKNMRLFYIKYQKSQSLSGQFEKCQTLSGKLSWSHYTLLLQISDDK